MFSVFLRCHASLAKGGVEDVAHESCKLLVLNLSVVINYDWSRIDQLDMSSFRSEESSVLRFIGILFCVPVSCTLRLTLCSFSRSCLQVQDPCSRLVSLQGVYSVVVCIKVI